MAGIGGGVIKEYEFTQQWGVNPAPASGTVVLEPAGGGEELLIEVGDYVVYQFGSVASFWGIVSEIEESLEAAGGHTYRFTVLDNRIRLQWQTVTAAWNMPDDRAGAGITRPAAPTIRLESDEGDEPAGHDVDFAAVPTSIAASDGVGELLDPEENPEETRWYWHILPEHAAAGIRTWTQGPLTARQILNSAFGGAWGNYTFARHYHAAFSTTKPIGMDFTDGVKLASIISQICDLCGMDVRIEGARDLHFERKGEGAMPVPPADHSDPLRIGISLTSNDTAVVTIGDENLVQEINIALEPDWRRAWEAFIDELAWVREVASVFNLPTATKSNRAELAARAREVTVAQYVAAKEDSAYADWRPFGKVSRMALPAWMYIRELLYKSYRIPRTYAFAGVPLNSLKFGDRLLCATEPSGTGPTAKQRYRRDPVAFYPDAKAECLVKGQPLDLIDGRSIHLFATRRERDLREEVTPIADFEIDEENFSVRFRSPMFIDGDPEQGKSVYLRVNEGEGGEKDFSGDVGEESDYLDVVVPNPDFVIEPAGVLLSVAWRLGKYRKAHGYGARYGAMRVPGLAIHALNTAEDGGFSYAGLQGVNAAQLYVPEPAGVTLKELLFSDGGAAEDKSEEAAESVTELETLQAAGSYTRHGQCGTVLTPCIDRVTVRIDEAGGLSETVDFTKARATNAFIAEKTMARMQRVGELFPGQQALRAEVMSYRQESRLQAGAAREPRSETHITVDQLTSKPIGAVYQDVTTYHDENGAAPEGGWKAGHLVWLDERGLPSESGVAFGGALVSKPHDPGSGSAMLRAARAGCVPVRCTPGIGGGGTVSANPGDTIGAETGSVGIGRLAHHEAVPGVAGDEPLAMVLLNAGGGAAGGTEPCPFGEIITWVESEVTKTGIRGGVIHCGDQNWNIDPEELSLGTDGVWLVSIKVDAEVNRDDDEELLLPGIKTGTRPVGNWEKTPWSNGTDYPENENPEASTGSGTIYLPVGKLTIEDGVARLEQSGCGNFLITHCAGSLGYTRV